MPLTPFRTQFDSILIYLGDTSMNGKSHSDMVMGIIIKYANERITYDMQIKFFVSWSASWTRRMGTGSHLRQTWKRQPKCQAGHHTD